MLFVSRYFFSLSLILGLFLSLSFSVGFLYYLSVFFSIFVSRGFLSLSVGFFFLCQ